MKKTYSSPTTEFVTIDIDVVMVTVSITGKPGDKADGFDASEHRSDWENIWTNM